VDYAPSLVTIAGVFLLGCLSPGPNFLVVTSRAVTASRQAGVLAGLGVALASLTWASLTIAGLALVLQHAAWLLTALRLIGAAYLIYLGIKTILGARRPLPAQGAALADASPWLDVWSGFLTSMTNPKAAAFFGSLFVVTLPIHAPMWVYGLTLAIVATLSAAWHCGLALFFSLGPVQAAYRRSKATVSTVMGGVLVLLGIRLLVAR
jgi:threonine efflux protein